MKRLSPREENVMRILWRLGDVFVKDVIAEFPDPKPPYNTISSIIRILEEKGYVGHRAFGRTYQYFPLITENEFRKNSLLKLIRDYFDGSPTSLVSHIVEEKLTDEEEIEQLRAVIEAAENSEGNEDE